MRLPPFALERYFARWEFTAQHLLCASDAEALGLDELLALADEDGLDWWRRLQLGYTESSGHPRLRREIAGLYETVSEDEVLVLAGAQEGIFLFANAVCGPGDHAVVVWPAYQSLFEVARSAGAEVTLVPLEHDEGWRLDLDRVRRAMTPRTRALVVNSPHSPTGAQIDERTFRGLAGLAAEAGCHLFSDEVYRFLEHDPDAALPAAADLGPQGVSLGVLSKAFGLAGLRVGWLACRDAALRRRLSELKDYTTICTSAPSEVLAAIALRARGELLARSRGIVAANLPLVEAFFEGRRDLFELVPPRGGTVAFPRLRDGDRGGDIDAFCREAVETAGVLLLPGTAFGHPGNHFRIGYGRRDFAEVLDVFERYLESAG